MLGDARLTLADAPDGSYDAIIVDAFSSDAIPIHLITREAMAIYQGQAHAATASSACMYRTATSSSPPSSPASPAPTTWWRASMTAPTSSKNDADYIFFGTVVAVARSDDDFGPIGTSEYWPLQTPDPKQWVWTDDYSNVVGALIRKYRE